MTYTSIEPNHYLLFGRWVCGWEEPVEQVVAIGLGCHWNRAGIGLANVKVDVRNRRAIYKEF